MVTYRHYRLQRAIDAIQERGVAMTVGKRNAEADITTEKEQQLITTIPYDKGWSAKLDGKPIAIDAFQDARLSV